MPTRAELTQRRSVLTRTWETVLGDGRETPIGDVLTGSIRDSWRRSSTAVSPEVEAAPVDGADGAVAAWQQTPVAAGLAAVADDVRNVADDGDLIAAVTDDQCRIVWTHGSRVMRRAAERVNFVPGGLWDEHSVGTNALALALRTRTPSTVYSAEHFSRAVHGWVCYSVPLTDVSTGDVVGVLDLSTTWDRAHPLALRTAQVLGHLISAAIPLQPKAKVRPGIELSVLGQWQVRLGGNVLLLPRRQVEILTLLSLHPEGLSLEALHARLYGDAPVSASTLKAEISHLRSALGGAISSRPYRLDLPVRSDLQEALDALDGGDVAGAVRAAGELLPGSESPDLLQWRTYLEVALRSAALASTDVVAVRALVDAQPYDGELAEHLLALLAPGDPRRSTAQARVSRALGTD